MEHKTTKTKPTRSKSAHHNGNADNDTNPLLKFEAELFATRYETATVIIEARSLEEAERQAEEKLENDEIDWEGVSGDAYVDSVMQVEGGQVHD
jgi:hypothetical protein